MNIDGHTRLLGLIGTPVGHSKSPAMYNYCFEKYGLNCAYLAFDVDMEHVADAINAIRTFNVMGCNVTMPLKNAVIPYLDEVSPASRAIGSVNTIVNKDGKLYGYVTDGKIVRNSKVRVVRDGIVIFEGEMASLRRFKDDVKEVAAGYECGIQIEKFNDEREGDIIEAYVMKQIEN